MTFGDFDTVREDVKRRQAARELRLQVADLARSKPPRFAWSRRIGIGRLNLLIGNEGIGKGAMIAWLIGQLTTGKLDGAFKGTAVNVGIVGDEDDLDTTWTPRLHAAGAALDRVCQIDRPDGGLVTIGEDRERLTRLVRDAGIEFLYFDQLLDNLGTSVDDWRQKQVREALAPLRALARELDIATLGTLHPNKRGNSFRELVAGAPAFNAASRSSLLLAQHPDDERMRVLVRGKGNLSERPTPLEFELVTHSFNANGHEFSVPLVTGMRPSEYDIDELIGGGGATPAEYGQAVDAAEIIEALLQRDDEWHPAKPIYDACVGEGMSDSTVKRAKQRLGIEHRRTETFPAAILWRWPKEAGVDDGQSTVGARVFDEPSEPSELSAMAEKPLRGSSEFTQRSQPSENTRTDSGLTVEMAANGVLTEDETAALILDFFPGSVEEIDPS